MHTGCNTEDDKGMRLKRRCNNYEEGKGRKEGVRLQMTEDLQVYLKRIVNIH